MYLLNLRRVLWPALTLLLTWSRVTAAGQMPTTWQKMGPAGGDALLVPLDNTGIADWVFLNPRQPAPLKRGATTPDVIRFVNQTLDRTIQVAVDFPVSATSLDNLKTEYQKLYDLGSQKILKETGKRNPSVLDALIEAQFMECTKGSELRCTRKLSVLRGQQSDLDVALIDLSSKSVITFKVSFFDPTDTPANQFGYIGIEGGKFDKRINAPDPVSVVGSISSSIDPLPPSKQIPDPNHPDQTITKILIDPEHPYDGAQRHHLIGSGKVDLAYVLGNRADGQLTLLFKDGDLGAKSDDDSNKLTAKQYQFNVYALNGISLRFGKMTFAQPANAIAVREAGEGFRLSARRFSLAHIIKRESAEGVAARDNDDARVWIAQMTNAPFAENHFFRRYSLLALYGEDKKTGAERTYETYGGEIFFGSVEAQVGGSLGAFTSRNHVKDDQAADGKGTVALLSVTKLLATVTTPDKQKASRSLTGLAGFGTGDDPKTKVDESYIGETASFAGDSIFLSSLAKPLQDGGTLNLRRGLTNKNYFGLQYNDNTWSLLDWVARALLDVDQSDIESKGTKISLHDYQFREAVFGGTDAGWEADLEFLLESPKGIKVTLGGAYFSPGKALTSLIKADAWAVTAKVSIEP